MTSLRSLPIVSTCAVSGCSYNHDTDCHAGAISVIGASSACGTYVGGDDKGGLDSSAHVGACHRTECRFNSSLECGAENVSIGPGQDVADCLTYSPR